MAKSLRAFSFLDRRHILPFKLERLDDGDLAFYPPAA